MSNRLTFSLASLVLMFAFVAMPVMAHGPGVTPAAVPENHTHPQNTATVDDPGTTGITESIAAHNHHPMVTSITLKGDNTRGTMAAVSGTTVGTTDVFTLVITFDRDIVTTSDVRVVPTGADRASEAALVADGEFSDAILNVDGTASGASVAFADSTRAAGSDNTIEVVATISAEFPSGTANANDRMFTFRVRLSANAVFSLETFPEFAAVPGGNSLQSDLYTFTLVNALPSAPSTPDTDAPTVMITKADDLDAMGKVVFTLTFNEALGTGLNGLQIGDIMITGGTATAADLTAAGNVYTLKVTPTNAANASVMISLNADAVADAANNRLVPGPTTMAIYDKTPPTVVITPPAAPDADGNLTFTFNFSEDIDADTITLDRAGSDNVRLGADSDPVQDATDSTVYTILVEPKDAAVNTTVLLLKGSVMDMAGNGLAADTEATYVVPGAPVSPVTITASPDPINCETGSTITFAITGTTETLVAGDITVSAGWKVGTDNDPSDGNITIVPDGNAAIGVTTVSVSVAANAVGNNAAKSETFTVGPILTIPAGGYITVIRPEHISATHLQDPLIVGSLGVRGGVVSIQTWECMPDLTNFFGRTAPGIGGGALVVKQSAAHTGAAIGKGTVGISEIMWATDLSNTLGGIPIGGQSNLDQTREQWIELHNLNNHEVKVTLFARPANAALTTETDEKDRVSNFNVRNSWDVKGQNGDSARGIDFISMQRGTATTAKNYAHGDFDGSNAGKWSASGFTYLRRLSGLRNTGQLAAENLTYDFMGTPGRSNNIAPTGAPVATSIPLKPFVINEVSNRENRLYEWIEIRNSSDAEANLRNYLISIVKDVDNEYALYTFPNVDIKLQPNELILVVASDPEDDAEHPLMVGHDVRGGNDQALGVNDNSPKYIIAGSGDKLQTEGIPDNGEFVMFLRRSEKVGAANAKNKLKTHEWVIDIAGYHPNLAKTGTYTSLWPLKAFPAPGLTHNKIAVNEVHFRRHADRDGTKTTDGNKADKTALGNAGYTGIGYRRHATNSAVNGGTPGYHDIRKAQVGQLAGGIVTISEIMFDQGYRTNYPQWIELYNSSATEAVNLHADDGWRLEIQNYDDGEIPINMISGTLNFKSSEVQTLLPQQTVLIASTRARNAGSSSVNAGVVFISTRVFSVWADARGALGMSRSTDPILSKEAFYLRLIDGKGNLSDEAGNLTRRRVRGADAYWNWSEVQGEAEMDSRSSVIRRYRAPEQGVRSELWDNYSNSEIKDMGIESDGWVSASETAFRHVDTIYYGHKDDIGTPGVTTGRALPVSLSKFRPERSDDGTVVVRWITQSELNNAGFNILRSETRDGAFTKLNTQLVKGHGTTSERNAYEFTDTSAKPNVVYYYQIQDVSFDGDVTTLQTTHLRGNVTAAGKLTTTWGELKALQ